MTKLVRAAGGLIVDPGRKGRFLVIHRPRYDDWTFPKGKLRDGEPSSDCALREVNEETGLVCDLLEELTPVHYVTPAGNLKTVRYWLMRPAGGRFSVNGEVDAVTWLTRNQALSLLTYDYDHGAIVEAQRRVNDLRRAEKRSRKSQPSPAVESG